MSESVFVDLKRRGMLLDAGKKTESLFSSLGFPVSFLRKSVAIDKALTDYMKLRTEFAEIQGTGDNLLANHKIAALYIWTLANYTASEFFTFKGKVPNSGKRIALVTFMYFVIYGILEIDPQDMDESIQDDLEYCLLKERPENLEWLCLTMHAFCRYRGKPTNIVE